MFPFPVATTWILVLWLSPNETVGLLSKRSVRFSNMPNDDLLLLHSHSYQNIDNSDGVDMSRESNRKHWPSSLPLPENTKDPDLAKRAERAMMGDSPPALEGRCAVNLHYRTETHLEKDPAGDDDDDDDSSSLTKNHTSVQWLHVDPPVLMVDDFLTPDECDKVLELTTQQLPPDAGRVIRLNSKVMAKSSGGDHKPQTRQSTTWYVRYGCKALAPLLYRLSQLLPTIRLNQVEEVQLVRYSGSGQGFSWHEDALDNRRVTVESGGQRVATVLVYLNDVVVEPMTLQDSFPVLCSGRTLFRDLMGSNGDPLAVAPKRGRALLFFPAIQGRTSLSDDATAKDAAQQNATTTTFGSVNPIDDTRQDHRTMHAGEPPISPIQERTQHHHHNCNNYNNNKHIAQLWIHSGQHTPVVFGRGLNNHEDAQKHIDLLKSRRKPQSQ